jgi:hypothetical protein
MENAMDAFSLCYQHLFKNRTLTDQAEIELFLTSVTLINPTYTLRPDQTDSINNSIFNSPAITSFMFDLSFRFFTLNADRDGFVRSLASSLKDGLIVDGPNKDKSIIPSEIAKSCPINVFTLDLPKWFSNKTKASDTEEIIVDFLVNNKHLMLVYLMYLNAE